MTTTIALYYRTGTAFDRGKDVRTCKRLAAELKHLDMDGQVLRKGSRVQLENRRFGGRRPKV